VRALYKYYRVPLFDILFEKYLEAAKGNMMGRISEEIWERKGALSSSSSFNYQGKCKSHVFPSISKSRVIDFRTS
jgi:hypothetical protein